MFTARTVITWLTGLGVDIPLFPGTIGRLVPAMPDRIGVVTTTSGGPLTMEGLFDTPGFQLRVRGAQQDPYDAETLALGIDVLILFAPLPTTVDGTRIVSVTRAGGRPSAMQPAPGSGSRSEFVCTYLVSASTLQVV